MLISPQMSRLKLEALGFFFSKRTSLSPKQHPTQMLNIKQIQHRCCDGVGRGARLRAKPRGMGARTHIGVLSFEETLESQGAEKTGA